MDDGAIRRGSFRFVNISDLPNLPTDKDSPPVGAHSHQLYSVLSCRCLTVSLFVCVCVCVCVCCRCDWWLLSATELTQFTSGGDPLPCTVHISPFLSLFVCALR